MRIGIDFDNTIICYDHVFQTLAIQQHLVPPDFKGTKTELRDTIRTLPDGDIHWQRLQGKAYGLGIQYASLFDGFKNFIAHCNQHHIPIYIVSHKTEYGHFDETRTSLRTAAREWLRDHGFFGTDIPAIPENHLFFETTREEKIERIKSLNCTHFIDDLIEVLDSPLFPRHIERILFQPGYHQSNHTIKHTYAHWHDIQQALFLTTPFTPEQRTQLKALLHTNNLTFLNSAGGGNSKVYCVETNGKRWAIKSYPPYAPNQRDRLSAESATYQFLNTHNIPAVPQYKSVCTANRWLIIEWIEGELPTHYSANEINQAIVFLHNIAALNPQESAKSLPLAAEACLSLDHLLEQIHKRLARLQTHQDQESELKNFLDNQFIPTLERLSAEAIQGYQQHHISTNTLLSPQKRSLIPADFGFHNAIRDSTGKLHFFDFDYFGWDDPVKLLADILWHPKMAFSDEQRQQFIHGITEIFANDDQFPIRFRYTYPLFGLRWALILLNEFIPDFWQNRQHAEVHHDQTRAKTQQLEHAKKFIFTINQIKLNG